MSSMVLQEPVKSAPPPEPDVHCFPPFSNVYAALDQIDLDGPDKLSAESLRGDIAWLSGVQRAAEAMSARWLAALDRREREAPPNLLSNCSSWLQDKLHLTHNAAYSLIRTARQLPPGSPRSLLRGVVRAPVPHLRCAAAG